MLNNMTYWSHNQNLKHFSLVLLFPLNTLNIKYKAQTRFCCFQASLFHSCMSISLMVSVSPKSITKRRCQGETQTKKMGYPVVPLQGVIVWQRTIRYYSFSSACSCKVLQMSCCFFRFNYLILKVIFLFSGKVFWQHCQKKSNLWSQPSTDFQMLRLWDTE